MNHYRAHGLRIASDVELPLPAAEAGEADFTLRRGPDRPVPDGEPTGQRLAQLEAKDGRVFYTLSRSEDGATMRYPNLCEFVGDAAFTDVTAYLHPGVDPGLLGVLAGGTLLAVHLTLNRYLVLHASAVQLNGHAVAFVGASGMGKSTLAAAMCSLGCGLVADDVLRVDVTADGVLVHPGSTETRLRQSARELADDAEPHAVRPTADGRLALRPETLVDGALPLAACVVPSPSRRATEVSVRRVAPARALIGLMQFPRVAGISDPAGLDQAFQGLAALVERVPVLHATVPWGPPFKPEVLTGLLDALSQPAAAQP